MLGGGFSIGRCLLRCLALESDRYRQNAKQDTNVTPRLD